MFSFTSSNMLTRPAKTKFYPFKIPVSHPQLRHLISTVDQDWIYLVSDHGLHAIHLPSQRKALLLSLPFSAKCIVVGLGWVCIGGDQKCASLFLRLNKEKIRAQFELAELSTDKTCADSAEGNGSLKQQDHEVIFTELGDSIVNSITLHELTDLGRSQHSGPVALVSNNDKSVKIYSLAQKKVIAELRHPFPINYALISPDSETLVAVGDSSQAYFYRRNLSGERSVSAQLLKHDWEILAKPILARGDSINDDHCFSVTFSPSGHLCAISSQGGMISVFDMESLKYLGAGDSDGYKSALVCSFKSSRSGECGFVRSMAFSPAPWDLLAWGEDHGRAGLADIRQTFCRQEILDLDPRPPNVEKILLDDKTDPAMKHLESHRCTSYQYQGYFQEENGTYTDEALHGGPEYASRPRASDLDPREQSVLDTLEVTMEEVDGATSDAPLPITISYQASSRPTRPQEVEERSPSRAHLESLIDVFRERNLLRNQGNGRQNQPRRRSSVVLYRGAASGSSTAPRLVPSSNSRSRFTASPVRMAEEDTEVENSRLPPLMPTDGPVHSVHASHPHSLPHDVAPSHTWNPWRPPPNPFESSTRTTSPPLHSRLHPQRSVGASHLANLHPSANSQTDDSAFGRSSLLPTAVGSAQSQTDLVPQSGRAWLRRAAPAAPLSELESERQDRRSSLTPAEVEPRDGRSRARVREDAEREIRVLEARVQARQRLATQELEQLARRPLSETTSARMAELTSRPILTDIALTRHMMIRSPRTATDGNGNWIAGESSDRIPGRSGDASTSSQDIVLNGRGIGTSGLGWSDDGRHL